VPASANTPDVSSWIPADRSAELEAALASAERNRQSLLALPGVVAVRAGYKFVGGRITRIPAVVVAVERKQTVAPASQVPPVLPDGVPTDVTPADPVEHLSRLAAEVGVVRTAPLLIDQIQNESDEAIEAVPAITYVPPPDANLDPITGPMVITCHVSPDAGWPVLQPFLESAREEVVVGMYDFTAPHIYQAVRSLLRDSQVRWRQTLGPSESLPGEDDVDSTKADDKTEASIITGLKRVAKDRFESTFARVGAGQTFASAYHIKVAVRDHSAFWLSSGNWQSSNQPDIDFLSAGSDRKLIPRYNREWHAVVEHPVLADTFKRYLEYDFVTARTAPETTAEVGADRGPDLLMPANEMLEDEVSAVGLDVFAPARFVFGPDHPLTVQPILTPDNYLGQILDLLRQPPQRRLFFQNQSLNPVKSPTTEWAELLGLLARYSNDPSLDVRIIFRNIGPIRKKLESLQLAGFNMDRVRVQAACHTKGIVIDSGTVLLGSHNWTNQGVQVNRDASLLIHDPGVAQYYERVFLHDWDRLAKAAIREEVMPIPIMPGAETAFDGITTRRVPWSAWEEE
jgi:phosphatidylserine/phosphatidylglycerophosphate/cardiolipin synthase-like enzyme